MKTILKIILIISILLTPAHGFCLRPMATGVDFDISPGDLQIKLPKAPLGFRFKLWCYTKLFKVESSLLGDEPDGLVLCSESRQNLTQRLKDLSNDIGLTTSGVDLWEDRIFDLYIPAMLKLAHMEKAFVNEECEAKEFYAYRLQVQRLNYLLKLVLKFGPLRGVELLYEDNAQALAEHLRLLFHEHGIERYEDLIDYGFCLLPRAQAAWWRDKYDPEREPMSFSIFEGGIPKSVYHDKKRGERIIPLLRIFHDIHLGPGDLLVDIGSGYVWDLEVTAAMVGAQTIAYDIDEEAIDFAEEKAKVFFEKAGPYPAAQEQAEEALNRMRWVGGIDGDIANVDPGKPAKIVALTGLIDMMDLGKRKCRDLGEPHFSDDEVKGMLERGYEMLDKQGYLLVGLLHHETHWPRRHFEKIIRKFVATKPDLHIEDDTFITIPQAPDNKKGGIYPALVYVISRRGYGLPTPTQKLERYRDRLFEWADLPNEQRLSSEFQPIWHSDPQMLGKRDKQGREITVTPEVVCFIEGLYRDILADEVMKMLEMLKLTDESDKAWEAVARRVTGQGRSTPNEFVIRVCRIYYGASINGAKISDNTRKLLFKADFAAVNRTPQLAIKSFYRIRSYIEWLIFDRLSRYGKSLLANEIRSAYLFGVRLLDDLSAYEAKKLTRLPKKARDLWSAAIVLDYVLLRAAHNIGQRHTAEMQFRARDQLRKGLLENTLGLIDRTKPAEKPHMAAAIRELMHAEDEVVKTREGALLRDVCTDALGYVQARNKISQAA
ncbi:hypothetical protein ACFL0T_00360 [Candidatus Omnitrophota bacterium]